MKPTTPCATHRTISRALGVSAATVSLALRNDPSIPERTRKRVRDEARRQHYRPDPNVVRLMQHLRTRRQKNLTANLVVLRLNEDERRTYEDHVLAGLRQRATELGFALELLKVERGASNRARLDRVLRARGVEGVILLPMTHPRDLTDLLPWENYSVVATSLSVLSPRFNTVVPNQFSNLFRLCDRLAELGKKRVGFVCTTEHDAKVNHRFVSAYLWESQLGPLATLPPLVCEGMKEIAEQFPKWVGRHEPEVVLTVSDGFLSSLSSKLPAATARRIEWACTGTESESPSAELAIYENPEEIGQAAVEVLAGMIQRGERGVPEWPRVTTIDGKLVGALAPKKPKSRTDTKLVEAAEQPGSNTRA